MPITEWSTLPATNNNRFPSGDHCSEPTVPRVVKRFFATPESSAEPHNCPPLIKTTRLLSGEITGSSPSERYLTVPPLKGIIPTCTLNGSVPPPGSTGRSSSQL